MFENVGGKIKQLAKIFFWVVTIACLVTFTVFLVLAIHYASLANTANDVEKVAFNALAKTSFIVSFSCLLGIVLPYIISLLLFSWGDTVENINTIKKHIVSQKDSVENKTEQNISKKKNLIECLSNGIITKEEYDELYDELE